MRLQVIEDDLVVARQADRTLSSGDFSRLVMELFCDINTLFHLSFFINPHHQLICMACRLLTMGRLMSLSYGETSLSLEHWQMVKEMERLRRERLK